MSDLSNCNSEIAFATPLQIETLLVPICAIQAGDPRVGNNVVLLADSCRRSGIISGAMVTNRTERHGHLRAPWRCIAASFSSQLPACIFSAAQ
jgi:hypothetical protein